MIRRFVRVFAVLASTVSIVCLVMQPAAQATPSKIQYGYYHEVGYDPGYVAWATFGSGTGSIRAYLGCASGNEAWVIYGEWFNRNIESDTDQCASMYTHGYNTRSQGGIG